MDTEHWKQIPGYDGYEVSDMGNVRSFRMRGGRLYKYPHLLSPSANKKGRLGVNLMKNGKAEYRRVAHLVLLAFIGDRPDGMVVCHNNDIVNDNRLENLRYDLPAENYMDAIRNKRRKNCLDDDDVRAIRLLYGNGGITMYQLADKYGITVSGVSRIINVNRRTHVTA